MRLVLAAGVAGLWLSACAHTVTNEERLEGMTDVTVDTVEEGSNALRCRETSPEIQIARDATQPKAERMARYEWAIADAKATHGRFDEAFRREPDLVYGPEAAEWKRRQAACLALAAELRKERDRVEVEPERVVEKAPARSAPVVEKAEKVEKAPAKSAPVEKVEKAAEPAPKPVVSAADEAFEDDDGSADELRKSYKKKAKVAKAKAKKSKHGKKKKAVLANR